MKLGLIYMDQSCNIHFHRKHKISCSSAPKKLPKTVEETRQAVRRDHLHSIQKWKNNNSGTITETSVKLLTRILGTPCEKPVPTGCSTQSTLDRFVQLNSFWVGFAWPQLHDIGYKNVRYRHHVRWSNPNLHHSPATDPRVMSIRARR